MKKLIIAAMLAVSVPTAALAAEGCCCCKKAEQGQAPRPDHGGHSGH